METSLSSKEQYYAFILQKEKRTQEAIDEIRNTEKKCFYIFLFSLIGFFCLIMIGSFFVDIYNAVFH